MYAGTFRATILGARNRRDRIGHPSMEASQIDHWAAGSGTGSGPSACSTADLSVVTVLLGRAALHLSGAARGQVG